MNGSSLVGQAVSDLVQGLVVIPLRAFASTGGKFKYAGRGKAPRANPLDHTVCYCGEMESVHPDGYAVLMCHVRHLH